MMDQFYNGGRPFFKWLSSKVSIDYKPILNWMYFKDQGTYDGDYVVYNTENLSIKLSEKYKAFLSGAVAVYDYSMANQEYYPVSYCPLKINKDIDYLFYGVMSKRREKIVKKLGAVVVEAYDEELQEYILRSKYVLSIGTHGNTHNDSARIVQAVELGGYVLAEKTEPDYDNYLRQFPTVELLTYDEILNHEMDTSN